MPDNHINLDPEKTNFATAVYGKDVRSSMVNLAEKIEDSVNGAIDDQLISVDPTLTQSRQGADAAVVGERFNGIVGNFDRLSAANKFTNTALSAVPPDNFCDIPEQLIQWEPGALSAANGAEVNTPASILEKRIRSNFIDLSLFTEYSRVIQGDYEVYTVLYDEDKTKTTAVDWSSDEEYSRKIKTSKYIRFVLRHQSDTDASISPTEGANLSLAGRYSAGITYRRGKNALFMGDSITYGLYSFYDSQNRRRNSARDSQHPDTSKPEVAPTRISDYISYYSGMDVDNVGVRGTGYVAANSRSAFSPNNALGVARHTDYSEYDLVALCYGINDYIQRASIGDVTTRTEGTVIGNLSLTIEKILSDNPLCEVIIYAPLNAWGQVAYNQEVEYYYGSDETFYAFGQEASSGGLPLSDYILAIKSVADYYGVTCVGWEKSSLVNRVNIKDVLIDGLHPSLDALPILAAEMLALMESENNVPLEVKKFSETTENLFDEYQFEHRWYTDASVSIVASAACSGYTPVVPGQKYTIASDAEPYNLEIAWFDNQAIFISRENLGANSGKNMLTGVAPGNAAYARAAIYLKNSEIATAESLKETYKVMFVAGDRRADYIPHNTALDYIARGYSGQGEFAGKRVAILGDSLSTYQGYIYAGNPYKYPYADVQDVHMTYWQRLIDRFGMVLGVNDSWSGSRVTWDGATESETQGQNAHIASLVRIGHLGGSNGSETPDIIIVNGGTNDILASRPVDNEVELGTFDYSNPPKMDDSDIEEELSALPVDTFAAAYKTLLTRLMYYYPNSKILVILPNYEYQQNHYDIERINKFCGVIKEACDYFGVKYFDARTCGITMYNYSSYLPDKTHYNNKGMKLLADNLAKFIKTNFMAY